MTDLIAPLLETLYAGSDLTGPQTATLFREMVAGRLGEARIAALLVALKAKGEHPEEIAGAARALRETAAPFPRPDGLFVDSCGTGGDGAHTVNISTAVAVVAAEAGVPVAKHGNRSVSSRCGSADVLEAVGVKIDADAASARRCLDAVGLCFLFAPQYHGGLRHAMPVRRALATRTMFNLLGPLVNPARPPRQVMGVYDPALCVPAARTLGLLGCERALVVHGAGLDEIALHAPTTAALLSGDEVTELQLDPTTAGVAAHPVAALAGGDPAENAAWLETVLGGGGTPAHRDAVAINAGALLWIADAAPDLADGTRLAAELLASGAVAKRLSAWAEASQC